MAVNGNVNPATHFGNQVRKERLARGWSLRELAAQSGIDYTHLSRIESGKRPPTEKIATAMDRVFPNRKGWFLEFYEDSRHAIPSGFRDWSEYEAKARDLVIWCPSIFDGSVQTPDYARAVLQTYPGVTPEVIEKRLQGRMQRQQRLLGDGGPFITWLVDHVALARATGSAEVMAGQMSHVLDVASLPNVTVQVVPAVAHPLSTALVIVADGAAYTEHGLGGHVYTEDETVTRLRALIGTVRGEAAKVSESLRLIQEAGRLWSGASQHTARTAAQRASRLRATAE